ncbi:Inner membrane protein YjcH [Castellaniella denitrificans]
MSERFNRIHMSPEFVSLVGRRRVFAWTLTFLNTGSFFVYLMVGILHPQWLTVPLRAGGVTTIGYLIGALLIILAWMSTGFYTWRANREFDPLVAKILEEAVR